MTNVRTTRVALALGAAFSLLGAAGAVAAAPASASAKTTVVTQGTATATVGPLVLEPTERGYLGQQAVTVRNTGTAAGYFRLLFREPVAGSFEVSDPDQFCQFNRAHTAGLQATYECQLNRIEPGAELTFQLRFRALTGTRPYAMRTEAGRVAISDDFRYDAPFSGYGRFDALFRSANGSLLGARPYAQNTTTDTSVRLHGDEVVLTRQPDGWYRGRLTATVRYGTDAPLNWLTVETAVPDDLAILTATDPTGGPCWRSCEVPGDGFMPGEERTFDLLFEAAPDSRPGAVAQATGMLTASWYQALPETDPADNAVAFGVHISDAG
ncbi:hypothetical protein [Micromonospora sp. NPDC007230]|uniref:hypothetical protein n=1 Tax=Micromonospora sp. NPDC007230 TaxID=3364237 RepID=UPI0036B3F36F